MSGAEALVPLVASVAICITVFGYIYFRSRENMALIDKNINPRQQSAMPKPFGNLKYGLLLLGAGMGLAIAFAIDVNMIHQHVIHFADHEATVDKDPAPVYFAMIAIGGGLGLVVSYFIERRAWERVKGITPLNPARED